MTDEPRPPAAGDHCATSGHSALGDLRFSRPARCHRARSWCPHGHLSHTQVRETLLGQTHTQPQESRRLVAWPKSRRS